MRETSRASALLGLRSPTTIAKLTSSIKAAAPRKSSSNPSFRLIANVSTAATTKWQVIELFYIRSSKSRVFNTNPVPCSLESKLLAGKNC